MNRDRVRFGALFLLPVLVGLVIAVVSAFGRQAQPHTITVTTRLVTISAVVTDKAGNAVTGLTKDDFVILDGGRTQEIAVFSPVTNALPPAPPPSLPPGTYTNILEERGDTPANVTIVLFDTLNSHWAAQDNGLSQVRKFLRQLQPEEHIGLYVLTQDGLSVLHDFTQNASALIAAIQHYDELTAAGKSTRGPRETTGNPELDRLLSGKSNRMNPYLEMGNRLGGTGGVPLPGPLAYLNLQKVMTRESLQVIARHLASVPGRKSLIWVTDGLPVEALLEDDLKDLFENREATGADGDQPRPNNRTRKENDGQRKYDSTSQFTDSDLDIERMVRLMNEAGVAIYPVSAEGLLTKDLGFVRPGAFGHQSPSPASHLGMRDLAERTGGRAFYDRNDVSVGIRRAVDDSRLTYSLGYYPDHNVWKGEFRKIQLKVNRPDVKILARQGYFALPDETPPASKDRVALVRQIAASPLDATQFPLTVHMDTWRGAAPGSVLAKVWFKPETLTAKGKDDRWQGQFEIVFFQLDRDNKILDVTTKTVDLNLRPATYEKATEGFMELPAKLQLKPHATLLCVILRDTNSASVGSVRIPIEKYLSASPN